MEETYAWVPVSDPEYDVEKERERLNHLEHNFMKELEDQYAAYLNPDWLRNDDWWGSQVTVD